LLFRTVAGQAVIDKQRPDTLLKELGGLGTAGPRPPLARVGLLHRPGHGWHQQPEQGHNAEEDTEESHATASDFGVERTNFALSSLWRWAWALSRFFQDGRNDLAEASWWQVPPRLFPASAGEDRPSKANRVPIQRSPRPGPGCPLPLRDDTMTTKSEALH